MLNLSIRHAHTQTHKHTHTETDTACQCPPGKAVCDKKALWAKSRAQRTQWKQHWSFSSWTRREIEKGEERGWRKSPWKRRIIVARGALKVKQRQQEQQQEARCARTQREVKVASEREACSMRACVCALCVCWMYVCECTMCLCVCVRAVLSLCGRGRISLSAVFVAVAIGIFRAAAAALASCCRCCCRPFGTFCNIVLASLFGAWPRRGFGSDSGSRCNALPWREDTHTEQRKSLTESHSDSASVSVYLCQRIVVCNAADWKKTAEETQQAAAAALLQQQQLQQ